MLSCPALFLFLQLLSVLYMLNHSACYIGFKRQGGLIETCFNLGYLIVYFLNLKALGHALINTVKLRPCSLNTGPCYNQVQNDMKGTLATFRGLCSLDLNTQRNMGPLRTGFTVLDELYKITKQQTKFLPKFERKPHDAFLSF